MRLSVLPQTILKVQYETASKRAPRAANFEYLQPQQREYHRYTNKTLFTASPCWSHPQKPYVNSSFPHPTSKHPDYQPKRHGQRQCILLIRPETPVTHYRLQNVISILTSFRLSLKSRNSERGKGESMFLSARLPTSSLAISSCGAVAAVLDYLSRWLFYAFCSSQEYIHLLYAFVEQTIEAKRNTSRLLKLRRLKIASRWVKRKQSRCSLSIAISLRTMFRDSWLAWCCFISSRRCSLLLAATISCLFFPNGTLFAWFWQAAQGSIVSRASCSFRWIKRSRRDFGEMPFWACNISLHDMEAKMDQLGRISYDAPFHLLSYTRSWWEVKRGAFEGSICHSGAWGSQLTWSSIGRISQNKTILYFSSRTETVCGRRKQVSKGLKGESTFRCRFGVR